MKNIVQGSDAPPGRKQQSFDKYDSGFIPWVLRTLPSFAWVTCKAWRSVGLIAVMVGLLTLLTPLAVIRAPHLSSAHAGDPHIVLPAQCEDFLSIYQSGVDGQRLLSVDRCSSGQETIHGYNSSSSPQG